MPDETPRPTPGSAADAWDATRWHEVEAHRDTKEDPNLIRIGRKTRIP
jgi:hypothetical protein